MATKEFTNTIPRKFICQNTSKKFKLKTYKKEFIGRSGYELTDGDDTSLSLKQLILSKIAAENTHDAALKYFENLSFMDSNLCSVKPYPGREHINIETAGSLWLEIFEDFMKYRENLGLESTESLNSELKILKDYIFCYLPWWNELHPAKSIQLPTSPADFERFIFFRAKASKTTNAPRPFLEMLTLRRKTINSAGRTISTINALYTFITGFADEYLTCQNHKCLKRICRCKILQTTMFIWLLILTIMLPRKSSGYEYLVELYFIYIEPIWGLKFHWSGNRLKLKITCCST